MKKILTGLLSVCACFIFADFVVPSIPQNGYVLDEVGVLDISQKQALNTLITALETETHHQIGIAIIKDLQGRTIEEAGLAIARTWGIGHRGVDNGLLMLVAPLERVVRIEVGRGLEGVMPDAIVNSIIDDYMIPAFAQNAYFDGIRAAIDVMRPALAGEIVQLPELPKNPFETVFLLVIWLFWGSLFLGSVLFEPSKAWWPGLMIGIVLGGIVLWLIIGTWLATGIGMVVSGAILGGMDWAFSTGKIRAARSRPHGGRWGGGGWGSGGGFGGGSFGGGFGGGGFGGGGASGRW